MDIFFRKKLKNKLKVLSYWNLNVILSPFGKTEDILKVLSYWNLNSHFHLF